MRAERIEAGKTLCVRSSQDCERTELDGEFSTVTKQQEISSGGACYEFVSSLSVSFEPRICVGRGGGQHPFLSRRL
jgi:hypothetical protein